MAAPIRVALVGAAGYTGAELLRLRRDLAAGRFQKIGGDEARLTITPPHDGEALVTVEGDRVLYQKRVAVRTSGTTIGSTIVGTFFAWLVTRTDLPYKAFMKAMFLVPFMLPSFIGALAWKMLLSPNAGFINKFFMN